MVIQTLWWILPPCLLYPAVLLIITVLVGYYYGTSTYDYWKKKGVPYIKPKYPFLGSTKEIAFNVKSIIERQQDFYNYFKKETFGGIYFFRTPTLFIKDPSLIESILIKDFSSICNRVINVDTKNERLTAHLVNLVDHKWKSLRQKLTPTFSSGKIKGMHQQLIDCSNELVKHLHNFVETSEPIEGRKIMAKFTIDVIGACVFGLNTNVLKDPNSEFKKFLEKLHHHTIKHKILFLIKTQFPWLLKFFQWQGMHSNVEPFFKTMLENTMSYREENNVGHKDFIHLLMELKKEEMEKQNNDPTNEDEPNIIIDDNVIASNAFVFFVAGFDTTSFTLSYCLYELAVNPVIQDQAYQHIVAVLKKHGGEITYDAIQEMTLIKQIVQETLRIHPVLPEHRRVVSKDYTIPGTSIIIPKKTLISIPVYSLHHDPEYFPDPETFKPERFDKDKENIQKGTYLPFGDGPRICIGKRFAEMVIHVGLAKLLLNFKFTLNPKTISPLVYDPKSMFFLVSVGGIWIDVQKRI